MIISIDVFKTVFLLIALGAFAFGYIPGWVVVMFIVNLFEFKINIPLM